MSAAGYIVEAYVYGDDCQPVLKDIKPGKQFETLMEMDNPGDVFCKEYMQQFGHLYK